MTTVKYADPDPEAKPGSMLEETVPDIINLTGSGMNDILAGDSPRQRHQGRRRRRQAVRRPRRRQ